MHIIIKLHRHFQLRFRSLNDYMSICNTGKYLYCGMTKWGSYSVAGTEYQSFFNTSDENTHPYRNQPSVLVCFNSCESRRHRDTAWRWAYARALLLPERARTAEPLPLNFVWPSLSKHHVNVSNIFNGASSLILSNIK